MRKDIERDAKAAAARIEKEAAAESDKILGEAKRQADAIKADAKGAAETEAERRKKDAMAAIEIESGSMLAAAREESIDRLLKKFTVIVEKRMLAKEEEIIRIAVSRFFGIVPSERSIVKINRRNAKLAKDSGASIEYADTSGVMLASADNRVTADATIEGLSASNAGVIRAVLSKGMFG